MVLSASRTDPDVFPIGVTACRRIVSRLLLSMIVWLAAVPIAGAQETWTPLPAISTGGTPTVWEKPQSKAWFHGHTWWTVLPAGTPSAPSSGEWLFRLEPTNTWTPVLLVSTHTGRADTLVVGDVTHVLIVGTSQSEMVSLEYLPGLQTYQLWSVRPTETPVSLGTTGTLAMDSTGRLWLSTPYNTNVEVYYSDAPYNLFVGPIVLDGTLDPKEYDPTAIVALPDHTIGVMWSNVTGQVWGFRAHVDGTDPAAWLTDEVPASAGHLNNGMADNHLHVTVAADGTLYASVKAASPTGGNPQLYLLVRHPNPDGSGTWDNTLYFITKNWGTRPIVVLNEDTNRLRVYFTDESGGNLYVAESARSPIQFSTPTVVFGGGVNNATSAKAPWAGRLVVLAMNAAEQSVLITTTPGLVGDWQMDDGGGTQARDFSGWGNDATLVGSPTWVPVATGLALNLNGSTSYATITDQAALDSAGALTLSAWIRPRALANQVLISRARTGSVDGYELALSSTGTVFARLNQASSGDTYRVDSHTLYPTTGTSWMHVAATYDGTTMRLYVNGRLDSSAPGPAAIGTGPVDVGLGAQSDGTRLFYGALDDVRIYNLALTGTEIAALSSTSPAVADLSLTNDDSATTAIAGQATTYRLRASNLGPDDADATVTDSLPAPATGATWTCTATAGAHCTASGSGSLSDTVHLPAGGSVTYLFQVTVATNASGTLTNTATVQTASVPDPVASNNSATDTDTILQPPTITTPPASVTVTRPNPATFTVVASGTPPLAYQWRRNGTPIGGATGTSVHAHSDRGYDTGAQFDVVVTNVAGTATSAAATLTVNVPPSVTTPPANLTVTAPNPATFTVVASGTAPLTYQWRRNGTPIGGATSAAYTLTPTAVTDSGAQFDVVVSNVAGSATSAAATLTVNAPPSVTTPPANITVTAPNPATFSVVASGTAPLTYQWRRNGAPIGGATSAAYTLTPTATTDTGAQFDVVVSNVLGTATSAAATLTVNVAPSITSQPASVTVTAPAPATFTIAATGTAPSSYQWRRNGTPISGATGASYTLTSTAVTDSGALFDVVVSNVAGSATSTAATLSVNGASGVNMQLTSPTTPVPYTVDYNDNLAGSEYAVAVWAAPNPNDSLLFVTQKSLNVVQVWNLYTNQIIQTLTGFDKPLGVAVDPVEGAVYVTSQGGAAVYKYFIAGIVAGNLSPALTFGHGMSPSSQPSGITVFHGAGGVTRVYVAYTGSSSRFVRAFDTSGVLQSSWNLGSLNLNEIAADDDNGLIYVVDQTNAQIMVYRPDGTFVQNFGQGIFGSGTGVEGLAVYRCGTSGYVLVSNQDANRFEIFDRVTFAHLASFAVQSVLDTIGVTLTQSPLPGYPNGAFFVQSHKIEVFGVRWDAIAGATGASVCAAQ